MGSECIIYSSPFCRVSAWEQIMEKKNEWCLVPGIPVQLQHFPHTPLKSSGWWCQRDGECVNKTVCVLCLSVRTNGRKFLLELRELRLYLSLYHDSQISSDGRRKIFSLKTACTIQHVELEHLSVLTVIGGSRWSELLNVRQSGTCSPRVFIYLSIHFLLDTSLKTNLCHIQPQGMSQ